MILVNVLGGPGGTKTKEVSNGMKNLSSFEFFVLETQPFDLLGTMAPLFFLL